MWLGQKSLARFQSFIHGLILAEDIYQIPSAQKLQGFDWGEFEEWVEEKYNPEKLTVRSFLPC